MPAPSKELHDPTDHTDGTPATATIAPNGKGFVVSNADEFFARKKMPMELVYLPGRGVSIYVRAFTSRDLLRMNREVERAEKQSKRNPMAIDLSDKDQNARMVIVCACNEHGEPIFNKSHLPMLTDEWTTDILPIVETAGRLSGFKANRDEREDDKEDFDTTESGD